MTLTLTIQVPDFWQLADRAIDWLYYVATGFMTYKMYKNKQ